MSANQFRSTTIYGKLRNQDSTDGSIQADGYFQRNITFLGSINNIPATVIGYLANITSNVQTQINGLPSSMFVSNNTWNATNNFNVLNFLTSFNGMSITTFNYLKNVTSDVQTQINNLSSMFVSNNTWNATNNFNVLNFLTSFNGMSITTFNYLKNVTSDVQTQFNNLQSQITNATLATTPPGTIIASVCISNTLTGYLLCDGSSVTKSTYLNLYNTIGDQFGNYSTTNFNVPNYQGLFLRGFGNQTINGTLYNGTNIGLVVNDRSKYLGDFLSSINRSYATVGNNSGTGTTNVVKDVTYATAGVGTFLTETAPAHSCVKYFIKT